MKINFIIKIARKEGKVQMFGKICFSLQLENNKEMHFSFLRNLMKMVLIVDLKLIANNVLMDNIYFFSVGALESSHNHPRSLHHSRRCSRSNQTPEVQCPIFHILQILC